MKKITLFTLVLICLSFFSCEKEGKHKVKEITLDVSVDAGTTYKLDLSQYGDDNRGQNDDVAVLKKQASNYNISAVATENNKYFYSYMRNGTPKTGGNGTDQVVIHIYEDDDHRGTGGNNGIMAGGCVRGGEYDDDDLITKLTLNITIK